MIVQCDACSTKFKLDDSKVTPSGVKVRCAKCKHVFLVRKEAPHEDVDVDTLLGKLDTQSPEGVAVPDPDPSGFDISQLATASSNEAPQLVAQKKSASEIRGVPLQANPAPASDEFDLSDLIGKPQEAAPAPDEDGGFHLNFGSNAAPAAEEHDHSSVDPSSFSFDQAGGDFAFSGTSSGEEGNEFSFDEPPTGFSESSLESSIHNAFETGGEKGDSIEAGDIASLDLNSSEWGATSFDTTPPENNKSGDNEELADLFGFTPPQAEVEASPSGGFDEQFAASAPGPEVEPEPSAHEEVPPPVMEFALPEAAPASAAKAEEGQSLAIVFPDPPPPSSSSSSRPSVSFDEELPPLVISSRRKSDSRLPLILAVVFAFVVAIGGGGYYMVAEKPELLRQFGLGDAVDWAQTIISGKPKVSIAKVAGSFVSNPEGELFVVRGEAVNGSSRPITGLKIRALLYHGKGVAQQKVVPCCPGLGDDQLKLLPLAQIETTIDKGVSVIPAGGASPFTVVFTQVPKDIDNFGVEVAQVGEFKK